MAWAQDQVITFLLVLIWKNALLINFLHTYAWKCTYAFLEKDENVRED